MTALLPPNLLRLFAPRAQPQFLKPLTKDEAVRGPNKLSGCGNLVKRIREEAEEAEYQEGLADKPVTKKETNGEAQADKGEVFEADKMDVDVKEEPKDAVVEGSSHKRKEKKEKVSQTKKARTITSTGPKKRQDKIAELGVVGQEAIKMRRELRKKRQEEYKKNLEKNCQLGHQGFC